jgi:MtaA/CmuA family methyltransferase
MTADQRSTHYRQGRHVMSIQIDSFRKAVALEEVERVPAIPTVSAWVARFSGIPLKTLIYDAEAMVKAQIDAQKAVGHDAFFAYIDPLYIPEAFGCSIGFLSSGAADAVPLGLQSTADVDALVTPDVRRDGRLPLMVSVAEQLVNAPSREVPVLSLVEGPFTNCARMLGTERMMRAVMKNKALVERLLDKVEELLSQFGRALEEVGVDGLIVADPVGSSTMVSRKVYGEMVLPHLQRFIRSLKIPVILHVCGDTDPILDMMAETGAKILSLDQCMDLSKAKEKLAGRCGIGGNVDPINALLLGTVEDVKRETLKCLQQGGKRGYVLMAGCAVPPRTPIENLRVMIETARL